MRRTRRKRLRLLGFLALLVVVIGGAAAGGWLPPVNRWVERRLLAELRVLGVETEGVKLRELSWRRAVVGPVELQLPGLALRAQEARAELGWGVLARRGAPHVVLRGLVLEASLDRLGELRGALQPQVGGFFYGQLDLEDSRALLRAGGRRLELPFSGQLFSRVEELRAVLVVDSPALAGRVTLRADLGEGSVEVRAHGVRVAPASWIELAAELSKAAAALAVAPEAVVRLDGTATIAGGRLCAAKAEVETPAFVWRADERQADFAGGKLLLDAAAADRWRFELRTERAAWAAGDRRVRLDGVALVLEPKSARLNFADGSALAAGVELGGGGEISAGWIEPGIPASGAATLRLSAARVLGWSLAAPGELHARWDGVVLSLDSPSLDLGGARPLRVNALESAVYGLREGRPRLTAKAQAAVDPRLWLGDVAKDWRLQPEVVAAQVAVNAVLERGQEGARVEVSVPQQRRTLARAAGRAEAVIGGDAVVNLDREYLSGRLALEVREAAVQGEGWRAAAPVASLTARWPRVWRAAVERWSCAPVAQVWREALWAGDYEWRLSDASVQVGEAWRAAGVAWRGASRGAEVHETGGLDSGLVIAELVAGGERFAEVKAQVNTGLAGGSVQASCALPGLPLRAEIAQNLRWGEGFVAEGTFGFAPAVFSGAEALTRWFPWMAGLELSGGVGVAGRDRFADGAWTLSADLILENANLRWPGRQLAVEGMAGRIVFPELGSARTAPAQSLAWRRAQIGAAELTNGSAVFAWEAADRLSVERVECVGFGGKLSTEAFAFDPRRPEPAAKLTVRGAQLEQLLRLFEDVPAEASGAVDGELPMTWRAGRLELGTGHLGLVGGELGRVRFTRDLHLLTSGRKPGGAEYESLRQVERAIQVLAFNRLRIDIHPQDAAGQSLRLRLVGAPAGGEYAVPVNLDVNVNAPLEHFLNLGLGVAAAAR